MSFHNNSIFWVDTGKIAPNPYQPRRDFDEGKLQDLADSIRQYGVLQPLVVTRKEVFHDDGGMTVEYELIAGERRLRASKLASVSQVPVVIRSDEEGDNVKLELAIIENLQREDLNPVDRARAFHKLCGEFGYKHGEIGKKVSRSREYVSNTIRLLGLPEEMMRALAQGKMKEGHARPLLMLVDRPEERETLFQDIILNKLTVRDAERVSRRIAVDRARAFDPTLQPEIKQFEEEASEQLGTRVFVRKSKGQEGGKVMISFSSPEDLQQLLTRFHSDMEKTVQEQEVVEVKETNSEPEDVTTDPDEDIFDLSHFSV